MNISRNPISRIVVAGVLLAGGCGLAAAQGTPGQAQKAQEGKTVRLNRAPVSKEVLRVKFPRPHKTTLDNGLRVLILEDHRLPLVNVQFNLSGAGGLYEPDNLKGLATVTATLMREGTKTRTSRQISEAVDQLGATLFVSSSFASSATTLSASGLSDNFDDWFALAVDVLLNPAFPQDELNRYRERTKVNLKTQRSQAGFLASERFSRAVYGSHPAGVVSMTPESLDAMTPEALAKWHRERLVPHNAILAIAGDVKAAELVAKLKKWLAAWQKTDLKEVLPTHPQPTTQEKIFLVDRPTSVQTNLVMGNISVDRRSPDYVAMTVMNRVLGGGSTARLFMNLREEKGYTYGAYSSFTALKYPGAWSASSEVRTEVTDGAMKEFFYELNRIRDEKVAATELEECKRSIVAGFALSLESPAQLLNYAVISAIYGFADDYWDKYPAAILAVTADDVQRVARKYVNPATMQVVAVGDAKQIKTVMEKYGPVEVYDTEGRPVAVRSGN
jgi:predicted Zn-dependent peptidase